MIDVDVAVEAAEVRFPLVRQALHTKRETHLPRRN